MIACVVLAGGSSRRLGKPKQLVQWRGESLLGHTLGVVRAAPSLVSRPRAVVIGASADLVRAEAERADAIALMNERFEEGVASSVRVATRWALGTEADALLLLVCDQPLLTAAHLETLIAVFRRSRGSVGSAYGGSVGVPAVFERARFVELLELDGDGGAKPLLRDAEAIAWPDGEVDVDTLEDLDALHRSTVV